MIIKALIEELVRTTEELKSQVGELRRLERPAVLARYKTAAGQSIPNAAFTIVNFGTKTYDSDSQVTTGAGWQFVPAVAGYYAVAAKIKFAGTGTWASLEEGILAIYVSGALFSYLDRKDHYYAGGPAVLMPLGGTDVVYLDKTKPLDIRLYQNSGAALTLLANADDNHVAIWKV